MHFPLARTMRALCRQIQRAAHRGELGASYRRSGFARWALAVSLPLCVAAPHAAWARGYFVSLTGSDAATGTYAQPWRKIGPSIAKLRAGDTLYVRGGKYFEAPVAAVSGTASAPIVIRSYPGEGVIVDSGYPEFQPPGNLEWELVDAATGEYRSRRTYSGGTVFGYVVPLPMHPYENGRVALIPYTSANHFRATTDQYNDSSFYCGPGTFVENGRIHIRLAKTSDLRATESRYGTVFVGDLPNPAGYTVYLSRANYTLRVSGSYLTFRGLTLHQAARTINIDQNVHHVRFEALTVWIGDYGIDANEANTHHVTVTGCRMYGDSPYWVFWSDQKDAPYPADMMRTTTINLTGSDWEIEWNHLRGSGQDIIGTTGATTNLSIHHNRIENAGDDALELEGALGRTQVYENFFLNCLVSVAGGQDSPGFVGPLFVYRNVMLSLRLQPINRREGLNTWNGGGRYGNEYMLKQGGSDDSTRNAHYYHNTMVLVGSPSKGINLTPRYPADTRVANNLLVTVNGPVNGTYRTGPGQVVDGDLYWKMNTVDTKRLVGSWDTVAGLFAATGLEAHGIGATAKRGTDPRFASFPLEIVDRTRSVWEVRPQSERLGPAHVLLSSTSPARGAGIVIPAHPIHGVLPDSRTSRDIGALPYGTSAAEFNRFPFNPVPPSLVDVAPSPGSPALDLAAVVAPQPMRSRARLSFTLPAAGAVRAELLDAQGRRVRLLLDRAALPAGRHTIDLDARTGADPLAPGVYFWRLATPAATATARVIVVR